MSLYTRTSVCFLFTDVHCANIIYYLSNSDVLLSNRLVSIITDPVVTAPVQFSLRVKICWLWDETWASLIQTHSQWSWRQREARASWRCVRKTKGMQDFVCTAHAGLVVHSNPPRVLLFAVSSTSSSEYRKQKLPEAESSHFLRSMCVSVQRLQAWAAAAAVSRLQTHFTVLTGSLQTNPWHPTTELTEVQISVILCRDVTTGGDGEQEQSGETFGCLSQGVCGVCLFLDLFYFC